MKKTIFALLLAAFSMSTSLVYAQLAGGPLDITGAGARAEGMGGAFIGVADDATAIVWNPAGLTQLERPEASFVLRQNFETYELKFVDFKESPKHFAFNFVSGAYPIEVGGRKLTIAMAYQQQVDLFYKGQTIKQTGGIYSISPSVAYRLSPMFSLGGTANFWTGTSKYREDDGSGYDDKWSGLNFQFGVMADFSTASKALPLRIGFTFRSPFKMTDKYTTVDDDKGTWKWDFPTMIGIGLAYRIGENLTLAADYEFRTWKKSKVHFENGASAKLSESGKNITPIRVGAEYLFVGSVGVIPVRVGFRTVPSLASDLDSNLDPTNKQVVGSAISVGSGLILKSFAIDFAATRITDSQKIGNFAKFETSKIQLTFSGIVYF